MSVSRTEVNSTILDSWEVPAESRGWYVVGGKQSRITYVTLLSGTSFAKTDTIEVVRTHIAESGLPWPITLVLDPGNVHDENAITVSSMRYDRLPLNSPETDWLKHFPCVCVLKNLTTRNRLISAEFLGFIPGNTGGRLNDILMDELNCRNVLTVNAVGVVETEMPGSVASLGQVVNGAITRPSVKTVRNVLLQIEFDNAEGRQPVTDIDQLMIDALTF